MKLFKILTLVSLIPSSFVFILFLFWISGYVNVTFLSDANDPLSLESVKQYALANNDMTESEVNQRMALLIIKTGFIVIAGLAGWISLYSSILFLKYHIKAVPWPLKLGLMSGVLAAILFPATVIHIFALPPITSAILIIIIWYKNVPDDGLDYKA